MDAKPTEIIYFIFSNQTKLILLPHNNILDLKSLKLCKKLKSFMILILIIFLRSVKLSHRNIHLRGTPVYTNPAYLANLGRVGEIALCQHSRPDVAARLAGHKCSSRFTLPPCHVIGTLRASTPACVTDAWQEIQWSPSLCGRFDQMQCGRFGSGLSCAAVLTKCSVAVLVVVFPVRPFWPNAVWPFW